MWHHRVFPHRWGLGLFLASAALNVFLLSGFAGGLSGAWAFEKILQKRLQSVTASLPEARQAQIEAALAAALADMQPQTAAVREAQQRWLVAFEQAELPVADLQREMLAIRQHREAANAILHQQALAVIATLNADERHSIAAAIRQHFAVQRPAVPGPQPTPLSPITASPITASPTPASQP
jgi:uncharacterized membrane protein